MPRPRLSSLVLAGALVLGCANDGEAKKSAADVSRPGLDAADAPDPADASNAAAADDAASADERGDEGVPAVEDTSAALAPVPADPWFDALFAPLRPRWSRVLDDPARFRFQLLVTVIDPAATPEARYQTHAYREDAEYVYPASAIKTFAAVAALRKLGEIRRSEGKRFDLDTPLALCSGRTKRCRTTDDESNLEGGRITLGHEIRKMQLVSNNTAFNRLMQFVGFDEFHADMSAIGFDRTFVHHPLWVGTLDADETLIAPAWELQPAKGKPLHVDLRERRQPPPPSTLPRTKVGEAYLDESRDKARVDEAMDFGEKNFVALRDFHRLTLGLVADDLPAPHPAELQIPDLGLETRHAAFLRRAMSEDPLASKNPVYDDEHKSELRYKTMLEGILRVRPRSTIDYVNKAGRAYGFHLENAYVHDSQSKRAFVVSFVIFVDTDGVLNDDLYEYDAISRPLLDDLGESLARLVFDGASAARAGSTH